ncbi:MAG: leucine-rich repeat domain-containing protein [Clostridia bacterium]|nr:leucine-rich repeat domain-containing protein [Clostridia bacterium]
MKNTIKAILVIACLVLSLTALLVLTSCDVVETPSGDSTNTGTSIPHVHTYGDWIVTKEPTCTENGIKEQRCGCGDTANKEIDALGHTEETVSGYEATCTVAGLTDGKKCSTCQETLVTQAVIPARHSFVGSYDCIKCDYSLIPSVGLEFRLNGNAYKVAGIGTCTDTNIVIPYTHNNKPVTSIEDGAFHYCSSISVIIPDSVTSIGKWAFKASNFVSIMIPNSVTNIGEDAFNSCTSLTSITIPDSVTSINNYTFYDCDSLASITVGNGVTSIGKRAFESCTSLTNITIPNGVVSIGDYAFSRCENLTSITIPDGVTSIGERAFQFCNSLTSITIPSSVTYIGSSAFYGCTSLTIYCQAESQPSDWDSNWNELNLHDSNCSVVFDCNNNDVANDGYIYVVVDGLRFSIKDNEATVARQSRSIKEATIPTSINYKESRYSVTNIGEYAFDQCTNLTNITIPNSVTSIRRGAFVGCENLTSVTISDSVTSIGYAAFFGCDSLTSITIPNSVTSIGGSAFWSCDSLTSITIPNSVTSIGSSAFSICNSLTSVNYLGTIEDWCNISFDDDGSNPLYYANESYINGELITELVIPNTVTEIKGYAFYGYDSLTSVIVPNSVTSIGKGAFSCCTSLTSVIVPNSVTSIGKGAFYYCTGLTNITVPDSVTSIGDSAFRDCNSLTSITIPNSITSIDGYTFYGCTSLTSITIPNGVTSIGEEAFNGCTRLNSIVIPNSVTSIGVKAFDGCSWHSSVNYLGDVAGWCNISFDDEQSNPLYYAKKLYINGELITELVIPNTVTEIKNNAFYNCASLTSITIPSSVTNIGKYAFYGCSSLTSVNYLGTVEHWCNISFDNESSNPLCRANELHLNGELITELVIPNTVTEIKNNAFYNCDSLTSITIPDSVTSIGWCAFENCTSLASITIPDGVTSIGYGVFYGCTSLTIYCEAESQPSDWSSSWNNWNRPVYWYRENEPTQGGNYWHYGENGEIVVWENNN